MTQETTAFFRWLFVMAMLTIIALRIGQVVDLLEAISKATAK